jgi:hypothetical protein
MRNGLNRWTGGVLRTLGVLTLSAVVACGSVGAARPGVSRAGASYPSAAHASNQTPPGASAPSGFQPAAASFVSPSQGWVLGSGGCYSCAQLRVTSDGGARWAVLPAPPAPLGYYTQQPGAVTDVVFANSSDGYLFGPGLLATDDGGRSWVRQPLPPVLTVRTGGGYVYALTQRGQAGPVALWRSAVGVSHWRRLPLPAGAAPLPGAYQGMMMSVEGGTLVLLQVGFTGPWITPGLVGRLWVSADAGAQWQAARSSAGRTWASSAPRWDSWSGRPTTPPITFTARRTAAAPGRWCGSSLRLPTARPRLVMASRVRAGRRSSRPGRGHERRSWAACG